MTLTRRRLLRDGARAGLAAALLPAACRDRNGPRWVNDVHSQLNRTWVAGVTRPRDVEACQELVRRARREGRALAVAGGRHAMGGQQFAAEALLADLSGLDEVYDFDPQGGTIEAGAGIEWPALMAWLERAQRGAGRAWGIVQKQTGADRLSLGGALSANVHGRGLSLPPFVSDVESFLLIDADGEARRCGRSENPELFRLAIGGYGLFGLVAAVRLRLAPRRKVERVVEVIDLAELPAAFERRIADGFLYGDFQYATDLDAAGGRWRGVFSCYRPADPDTPLTESPRRLSAGDWRDLLVLAHTDPAGAFERYAEYYLSTSGQVYWADTQQLSAYVDDYHRRIGRRHLGDAASGSEMITEIYVPRAALVPFMEEARRDLRERRAELIYGTVRLIERDEESVLAWARQPWACVIFNLHTQHGPAALTRTAADFRSLIDLGIRHGGSYYLTYHRWASPRQVLTCYPGFVDFLRCKRELDPEERFQSDWYRHYRRMFADRLA